MNIYSALHLMESIPHNPHHLNRYRKFILSKIDREFDSSVKIHKHHILPRANDMFPNYGSFKDHSWNKIKLTPREHYIAHLILCKAFPDTTMNHAFIRLVNSKDKIKNGKFYENICKKVGEIAKRLNEERVLNGTHPLQRRKDGTSVSSDRVKNGTHHLLKRPDGTSVVSDLVKEGRHPFQKRSDGSSVSSDNVKNGKNEFIKKGLVVVRSVGENRNFRISNKDPRFLSGELISTSKNMVVVTDEFGYNSKISVEDFNNPTNKLVGVAKNTVTVKDKDGNYSRVNINHPKYLSGELVGVSKDTVLVKEKDSTNSKGFAVSIDDPRYLSGELVGITKGKVPVRYANDPTKKCFSVFIDDPRYLSGELVHIKKGKTHKNGKQEIISCPHCGKFGGRNLIKRHHFDNCKLKI